MDVADIPVMIIVGHVEGRRAARGSDVAARGGGGTTQRHSLSTCHPDGAPVLLEEDAATVTKPNFSFNYSSFLVGKVKLVPNILRHNLVPCRKRVDFLCGIGRSSFIAEAHTVTGEDTHGSGGLQVCGPARSLQTGTGS